MCWPFMSTSVGCAMFCQKQFLLVRSIGTRKQAIKGGKQINKHILAETFYKMLLVSEEIKETIVMKT